jgi:hypothetical protein
MRASSEILKAIRTEVFGESQQVFGKRLPLAKETISRLELRKEGHPVTARHLRLLRELRAPMNKAKQFEALVKELEAAIWREIQADLGVAPGAQDTAAAGTSPTEAGDPNGPPAGALPGEAPLPATPEEEEAARRTELLRLEEEARRAEEFRRLQEAVQRAEAAVQRAEQLRQEEDVRRAAQASRMAEEEARFRARRQRAWRSSVAVVAVLVALGGLAHFIGERSSRPPMEDARAANHQALTPELPDGGTGPSPSEVPPPEEGTTSGGLDAGTAMAELLKGAQPMPTGGLPRQQSAPCPEDIEEFNGYCWLRSPLTPGQVKAGACDEPGLYEPSAGWCRTHKAGFRPWHGPRRINNAVDP